MLKTKPIDTEIEHITLHTLDRFIEYNQFSVRNAAFLLGDGD
jgi:hypothetical protein